MKTLVITAVFALGSLTAFSQVQEDPQTQDDSQPQNQVDPQQQVPDNTRKGEKMMDEPKDKMGRKMDKEMKRAQKGFREVSLDELPEAINTAVEENYPNAKVDKVLVNKKMQYQLETTKEDGSTETLMMDKEGNPIQG